MGERRRWRDAGGIARRLERAAKDGRTGAPHHGRLLAEWPMDLSTTITASPQLSPAQSGWPETSARRLSGAGANPSADAKVLRLADIGFDTATAVLAAHGLELVHVADGTTIPGSYWGEPEAGVIASRVYARADTPLHSLLHEACHLLVAAPERRPFIHTDASDSNEEEDATCYLQILLADALPGFGRERAFADMDAWGYSFRFGSARAWFEHDADDARAFLEARGLV